MSDALERGNLDRPPARFPAGLYRHGLDPDPRFSLANERTFLAWIRTALALLAAGVVLSALEVPVQPGFRAASAGVFVALGFLATVHAWFGWIRTERSLRGNRSMPGPAIGGLVVTIGVCAAVGLLVIGLFL